MTASRLPTRRRDLGDFQTPPALALAVAAAARATGLLPASILEPTCGTGSILTAAAQAFPSADPILGFDINPDHVAKAISRAERLDHSRRIRILQADFFTTDWPGVIGHLPEPVLVIGNPPWVTNSELGADGAPNTPPKANLDRLAGLDAITGKSNFDISEWILLHLLEALHARKALLAFLCKTTVARKVVAQAAKRGSRVSGASIYLIDAMRHFGVSVDACLFVCQTGTGTPSYDCAVFPDLEAVRPDTVLTTHNGSWISDCHAHARSRHLEGRPHIPWRSGIKHDCAKMMELTCDGESLRNGLGEIVRVEEEYLYPLLKCSDLFHGRIPPSKRWMLVPQRNLSDDTTTIQHRGPDTWAYLLSHSDLLASRKSSIYKDKPPFAIFGVGPYSFAPWKVAVSGLHADLRFRVVGPTRAKPVVFDDTCYFLPCETHAEAVVIHALLSSPLARDFYGSRMFSGTKRSITKAILQQLDISAVLAEVGPETVITQCAHDEPEVAAEAVQEAIRSMALRPTHLALAFDV